MLVEKWLTFQRHVLRLYSEYLYCSYNTFWCQNIDTLLVSKDSVNFLFLKGFPEQSV